MPLRRAISGLLLTIRGVLCPVTIYFLAKGQFALAFNLYVVATLTLITHQRLTRSSKETPHWLSPETLCERLYCLSFFSVFMAFNACPAWFLGLLMTVSLLQVSGGLFLRYGKSNHASLFPMTVGRINTGLQLGWIGLTLFAAILQNGLTSSQPIVAFLPLLGYAGLATFQIFVFFVYFSKYRPKLVPHLVPLFITRD